MVTLLRVTYTLVTHASTTLRIRTHRDAHRQALSAGEAIAPGGA